MNGYVDCEWVLGGRKTPLWEKPGYLTNSQLTTTTRNLNTSSRLTKHDPSSDKIKLRHSFNRSLSNTDLSLDLQDMDRTGSSLKKSVSFSNRKKTRHFSDDEDSAIDDDETDEELMKLMDQDDSQIIEPAVSGRAKTPEESQWYTKPSHLLTRANDPVKYDAGLASHVTPANRLVGSQGAKLANINLMLENADRRIPSSVERYPLNSDDPLAKEFFPTTFSAQYILNTIKTPKKTITPKPEHLRKSPPPKWRMDGKVGHWTRSRSQSITKSLGVKARSTSPDRRNNSPTRGMYLMSKEAPHVAATAISTESPYQFELARLRMERLRLEEAHLLDIKRQEELERIRGPKPKWYELKTPDFHYEAHKNNDLINNEENWQDLLDYRNELLDASADFERSGNFVF